MTNLNIRVFPPELLRAMKVEAAKQGISLRELVISTLRKAFKIN